MLVSVLINVAIVLVGWILTYVAIEVAIAPLESSSIKRRVRWIFAISASLLVILTTFSTVRSEREQATMPQKIATYIRNTTPPIALPVVERQAPPTGLIVSANGNWGTSANQIASELFNFLRDRGEPPVQRAGEADVDFVVRSNAWYSSVMGQYRKQFGDRVITLAQLLLEKGVLDPGIASLAKDPANPIGIRMLATQIDDAGRRYTMKYPRTQ